MSTKDSREIKDIRKVKDIREVKEERKRRSIKTESSSSQSTEKDAKRLRTDQRNVVAKSSVYNEEEEACSRDPQKDQALYHAACNEIRLMMEEIKELKEKGKQDSIELAERRIHGTLQFATLKKLNRISHVRGKKVKDATHEAKLQIDQHHLQLQNLLYEVMHLQKEITKCLEFKSKHEEIDLVPVEEFFKEAPEKISKQSETKDDIHKLTIARLDWEQEQRKSLAEQLDSAQAKREEISKDIKTQQEYLESLQPKLNSILEATKPVQDYLGMPFDEVREQHKTAQYLPSPLYVLYVQTSAYKDACDKDMNVTIKGDIEEAKSYENSTLEIEEDSDNDEQDQEEQEPKKSKRRRKTGGDRKNQKKDKILKKHPLSVLVQLKCKDGALLQLMFYFVRALQIVTVKVRLVTEGDNSTSVSGGDLVSKEHLLSCLYPDDRGTESPNPVNQFDLKRLDLGEMSTYIKDIGHPYKWAQRLAGLQFVTGQDSTPKAEASVSAGHIEETMKKLKTRVNNRLSLQKQLAALEQCQVLVSKDYQSFFFTKISSKLATWKRSTFEDISVLPYCESYIELELIKPDDLFFIATVERGSATATVQVVIHDDYPSSAPVMIICLKWNKDRTALNDQGIKDMEAEVNLYCNELSKKGSCDQLLTNQIQRLLMCMDVYLELESTDTQLEGPLEFPKERIYTRSSRGPNRGKPYCYNQKLGFFCHR